MTFISRDGHVIPGVRPAFGSSRTPVVNNVRPTPVARPHFTASRPHVVPASRSYSNVGSSTAGAVTGLALGALAGATIGAGIAAACDDSYDTTTYNIDGNRFTIGIPETKMRKAGRILMLAAAAFAALALLFTLCFLPLNFVAVLVVGGSMLAIAVAVTAVGLGLFIGGRR